VGFLRPTDRQAVQIASQLRSGSASVVGAEITDSRITQRSRQRAASEASAIGLDTQDRLPRQVICRLIRSGAPKRTIT
jgi:hypothetical protein